MSGLKIRIRRGFTVLFALLLVSSVAFSALSYPFYTTTTDSVRMRKSASSRAVVVDNLSAGEEIEVLGKTGSYYKVKANGKTGYVHKDYVNTDESAITTPTPEVVETVTGYPYASVTREQVNLRETKNVNGKLLKKIPAGANIVVRASSGTWAEIEYEGYVGFVKNAYVVLKKVVKPTPTPTPVPTLSPEENAAGYRVLQKGSEGADVKALQEALLELGFMNGTADGKFGSATENAVNLLQQKNDYPITGVVDANLQAFLYSGKPKNAKGEATKIHTVSPVEGASLSLNSTGDPVAKVQERLKELGYYQGEITRKYDKATQAAVKAFQKASGLKADGVAGKETQDLLFADDTPDAGTTPTPTPTPTATPEPSYVIPSGKVQRNSEGEDAKLVQSRLKELGYYKGRVDGKFGAQSVVALKKFQEANGLKADGIAGETTYQLLFSFGAVPAGATPTPEFTETPEPAASEEPAAEAAAATAAPVFETLRKGDKGEGVRLMQEALINLGYLSGKSDGTYGDGTVQAVRAFQKANGLTVDGTAGNDTLQKLYSVDAAAAPTAKPTATPKPTVSAKPTATPKPTSATETLKKGSAGDAVKALQQRLIALGYLKGSADGKFGTKTYEALMAFQRANKLKADGVAGAQTQQALNSTSAVAAGASSAAATAAPTATPAPSTGTSVKPSASRVLYANWYTTVKAIAKKYPYCTVYDYQTGISWQIHIFSLGTHADYEPLTANDTAKMLRVFGGNTWNPRPVWVIFGNGSIYMGSTHSMPHEVQHITSNNFEGHSCLHFPRTQEQVESIGTYATSHQKTIDQGWAATQAMK